MTVAVFDVEQGTDTWHRLRLGIPTASEFATVMASGRNGGESVTRRKYMLRLAGERLSNEMEATYSNHHFERGKEMEAEARDLYAFMHDAAPETVGFMRNGDVGCSPDALVEANGLLEIKTALPSILIDKILRNAFPPEHKAQCQGQLWIAEREWLDLAIYWPKLPLFVKRAYRDEPYIRSLAVAVDAYNDELAATVEQVRAYGGEPGGALKRALAASIAETAPFGREARA